MAPVPTAFHAATYQLLEKRPQAGQQALDALQQAEQRLGMQLSASVREWFSLQNALEILNQHSNCDPAVAVSKWKIEPTDRGPLVQFKVENQGVCDWLFLVDGSDDPPVYVRIDRGDEEELVECAQTFSAYILSCVWDFSYLIKHSVMANVDPIDQQTQATLRQQFSEQPPTYGWPGDVQNRFAGDGVSILLWTGRRQTDWIVGARSLAQLEAAIRQLWPLGELASKWYGWGESNEVHPMLARLRQELATG